MFLALNIVLRASRSSSRILGLLIINLKTLLSTGKKVAVTKKLDFVKQ